VGNILIKSPVTGERKSLTQSEFFSYMAQTNGEILRYVISEEVDKHGDHDQTDHGNRDGASSSELDDETAAKIQQFTRDWGGLSIKMTDGSLPDKGFMVSKPPTFSKIVPKEEFYDKEKGKAILREYMEKNEKDLATGTNYLGTWENEGKIYLDVSMNVSSESDAVSLGRDNNQKAVWDVINQKEIQTGGTGSANKSREQKAGQDGTNEGHFRYDRGTEGRLRDGTLGKINQRQSRSKVIYFDYGLKPVLKHDGHDDQSSHGNWATGRSEEDVKRISEFKDRGPSINLLNETLEEIEPTLDRDKAKMMIDNDRKLNAEVENRIASLVATIEEQNGEPMSEEDRLDNYDDYRNQVIEEYMDEEPDSLDNFSQREYGESIYEPKPIDALKESLNDVYGLETTATFRDGDRQGESITLTSSVDEVTVAGNVIRVVTNIRDEMGNPLNDDEIIRYLVKNEETGTWSAEHSLLRVNKEFRGLGFGSKFLQQSEDYYVAKGFTHIELNAGLQDGARHWANSGFDWNRDKLTFSIDTLNDAFDRRQSDIDLDLTELNAESKIRYSEDLQKGREILSRMTDGNGNIRDMKEDDFPTPKEFASLGADKPLVRTDGTTTWSGKELLAREYLPYMKVLTAEGQNLLSGPIDMDGDGLVYDGTPREKPVSSVGKK